jgi:hypothetical protein
LTRRFPIDLDPGSSQRQITQIGVAFTDDARIVGEPEGPETGCWEVWLSAVQLDSRQCEVVLYFSDFATLPAIAARSHGVSDDGRLVE